MPHGDPPSSPIPLIKPKEALEVSYRDARRDYGTRWTLLQNIKLIVTLVEFRSVVIDVKKMNGNCGIGAAIHCPPSVICYNLPS